jgi:hypothetical protein
LPVNDEVIAHPHHRPQCGDRRFLKDRHAARREIGTASASATEVAAMAPVEPEDFKVPAVHYASDYYRQLLDVSWGCSMPTQRV